MSENTRPRVILYTIHCPLCNTLKRLLDQKHIVYEENTSMEEMTALGMTSAPHLGVDDDIFDFGGARDWLRT